MLIKQIVSLLFSLGMFFNAMLFVPQAMKLIRCKNADDLSLFTFIGFCVTQIISISYGFVKQDILIIIGYAASLLTCGVVTSLIIIYRRK